MIEDLSRDPDPDVRATLAHNLETPPSVLARLVDDPVRAVQRAALAHPRVPSALLERPTTDEDERAERAAHPGHRTRAAGRPRVRPRGARA